ncbi:MAG TPA: serpin family protein [Bacteroidales bacterium]|nr:serpin family protein [Bacteroidales bacterium]
MKTSAILLLMGMGSLMLSCTEETEIVDPRPVSLTPKQQQVVAAGNDFGFNALRTLLAESPDSNLLISPFSISTALAMTLNGAEGATEDAMRNVLGFQGLSTEEVNATFRKLLDYLPSADPVVTMEIANSIWHHQGFSIVPAFLQENQDNFGASVYPADFSNPATVGLINDWVSASTHGKITSIVDQIPPEVVMYLINALYFQGDWTYAFDTEKTQTAVFSAPSMDITVEMMQQRSRMDVLENSLVRAVRLPYGQGRYGFIALLPAEGKSMDEVLLGLNQQDWGEWMNQFVAIDDFQLYLPKFHLSWEKELNELLTSLGMGIAFDPALADFSGINPSIPLYISEVKHKAFMDVNEEGTEAAAVTSVGMGYNSVSMLRFDEPFLCFIVERYTGLVVFSGFVTHPGD